MRTVRCSARWGGGACIPACTGQGVYPSMHWVGCLPRGGVSAPPGQNDRRLWKHYLATTTLRTVMSWNCFFSKRNIPFELKIYLCYQWETRFFLVCFVCHKLLATETTVTYKAKKINVFLNIRSSWFSRRSNLLKNLMKWPLYLKWRPSV